MELKTLTRKFDWPMQCLVAAIILHIVYAFFSEGYYHPDEHFQILEFSNLKLGLITADDLPWEYKSGIRSSFQPWISYCLIYCMKFLGIQNVYTFAFVMRAMMGLLSAFAISRFVRANTWQVQERYIKFYIFLSYFLWFLPFLNIRFSSESLSGIFFLLALSYIREFDIKPFDGFRIGLFCGLAFIARYQCAFMIFGLVLWLVVIKRAGFSILTTILIALGCTLLIGILLDRLFYGSWLVTSWNYFYVNIVQDVASKFGVDTWYTYLMNIMRAAFLPVGIIIFTAFFLLAVYQPRSVFVWVIVPFLLVHLIVPHKEVRFMFAIVNLIPIIMITGYQVLTAQFEQEALSKVRKYLFVPVLLFFTINICLLSFNILANPFYGGIATTRYIYDNYKGSKIDLYSFEQNEANPFKPYLFLNQSFYLNPDVSLIFMNNDEFMRRSINSTGDRVSLLVVNKYYLNDASLVERIENSGMKKVYQSNPDWIIKMQKIFLFDHLEKDYILYKRFY